MTKCVAQVYITRYSIQGLVSTSTPDEIEKLTYALEDTLSNYCFSKNVDLECAIDIFDFEENERSLNDDLLDATGQWDTYQYYLSELAKVITPHVRYNHTEQIFNLIKNQNSQENIFPRNYSFILCPKFEWPNIDAGFNTHCWSNTLTLNSIFIANFHNGSKQFIEWSDENYEYLDFSENIESTLNSIQIGNYLNYKFLLSHSLNSLNQSYHFISEDPAGNINDLNTIADYTSRVGKTLMCTRQGSNKVYGDFVSHTDGKVETINCEYHLKINWNDSGVPIPKGDGNPVRVYFGLKSYPEHNRKQFKIAHLGKHL